MLLRLLRHATLTLDSAGLRLLVDPMLSHAQAMDPVANAANARRIPLVDLPVDDAALGALLAEIDALLVTHVHRDHWDRRAVELIRKDIPLFCQPGDEARFQSDGFTDIRPIVSSVTWRDVRIDRTGGHHGTGEIGQTMGNVSGFVLRAEGEPVLHIAGDTIWCAEVEDALKQHKPDVTVVNAGAAQFLTGDPITMSADDVVQVCRALRTTRVVAVHMEAVNHCLLTRADLRAQLEQAGCSAQVAIPADGQSMSF